MSNLFRRTLTGACIVIFILGGLWLHPVTFFVVGLVLMTCTQYEYCNLIRNEGARPQVVLGITTSVVSYVTSTLVALGTIPVRSFLILIPLMSVIMVVELYRKQEKPFDSLAHTFFSVLYTALPFSMFPFAAFGKTGMSALLPNNNIIFSPGIVIGFFILIWSNDTGAYLTGVSVGRHKMIERISPKKTWEGFFGGLIIAALIAWLISGWLGVVDKTHWIIISIIISVAGTYGDLIESMLKRDTGVKDSGNILPGHGGFLDRFDSAILSFPLVFLFILLFC